VRGYELALFRRTLLYRGRSPAKAWIWQALQTVENNALRNAPLSFRHQSSEQPRAVFCFHRNHCYIVQAQYTVDTQSLILNNGSPAMAERFRHIFKSRAIIGAGVEEQTDSHTLPNKISMYRSIGATLEPDLSTILPKLPYIHNSTTEIVRGGSSPRPPLGTFTADVSNER